MIFPFSFSLFKFFTLSSEGANKISENPSAIFLEISSGNGSK